MIPLVLVHGFMGGGAQWQDTVEAFSVDRQVIAVDLPGFGANTHLPTIDSIPGFATWVISELRRRGVERYALLGHSMGGMIVQEMARLDFARIDHLILYATSASGALPGRFETIEQSKARASADGAIATARRISATWFLDYDKAPGYAACAALAEQSTLQAMHDGLDAMKTWTGIAALPDLTVPTSLIWGDRDRTYRWEQIHQLWTGIPNTSLAVLPGCAHAAHAEKPQLFNNLLRDILARRPSDSSR